MYVTAGPEYKVIGSHEFLEHVQAFSIVKISLIQ